MDTFAHIIALWPTTRDLAADIGANHSTVRFWKHKGSIPARWWHPVVAAAVRRGIKGVDLAVLAEAAASRKAAPIRSASGEAA